jgi:hypothetical protein
MTTYYVANGGSNSNSGTSSGSPWQTIAHSASAVTQGDTVNLLGSSTFLENVNFTSGITLQTYGGGQATVSGYSSLDTLTFTNCGGVTVNNLQVTNADATGIRNNIYFTSSGGSGLAPITVTNCLITGGGAGINCYVANSSSAYTGVTFSYNTIHDVGHVGIITGSPSDQLQFGYYNVVETYNTVYNVPSAGTNFGFGVGATSAYNVTIGYNHVYNIGYAWPNASGAGPGGVGPYYCTNAMVIGNLVHDIYGGVHGTSDGGPMDLDFEVLGNSALIGNVCYNCDGGMLALSPGTFAWNLCIDCGRVPGNASPACMCDLSFGGSTWYNNTAISLTANVPAFEYNTGTKAYNNIFVSLSGHPSVTDAPYTTNTVTFRGNGYYTAGGFLAHYRGTDYTTISAWRSAGFETSGEGFALASDPCYAPSPIPSGGTAGHLNPFGVYALTPGNTLVSAGLDLNTLFSINPGTSDLLGNSISVPYSVGAINPAYTPWLAYVNARIYDIATRDRSPGRYIQWSQ